MLLLFLNTGSMGIGETLLASGFFLGGGVHHPLTVLNHFGPVHLLTKIVQRYKAG